MTPALDYLINSEIIRNWIELPCSLFLQNREMPEQRLIITIDEEFKKSNYYSVKHWKINECTDEQALPPMNEYRVLKKQVFKNKSVILNDYRSISYRQESIDSHYNNFRQPMSRELYFYYYEISHDSSLHKKKRINWLWYCFVKIYVPQLYSPYSLSTPEEQMQLVNTYMKRQWKFWTMWKKHLLLFPGELVFAKEYEK